MSILTTGRDILVVLMRLLQVASWTRLSRNSHAVTLPPVTWLVWSTIDASFKASNLRNCVFLSWYFITSIVSSITIQYLRGVMLSSCAKFKWLVQWLQSKLLWRLTSYGVAVKKSVSLLVANIPALEAEYHRRRLDDCIFVSWPSHVNVPQVSQNGIHFLQESTECLPIIAKVGWIDIL